MDHVIQMKLPNLSYYIVCLTLKFRYCNPDLEIRFTGFRVESLWFSVQPILRLRLLFSETFQV